MVHSPMAGGWRHPPGARNQMGLVGWRSTGAGGAGLQVHLLRCTEVEKSSGGTKSNLEEAQLCPSCAAALSPRFIFQHHPRALILTCT